MQFLAQELVVPENALNASPATPTSQRSVLAAEALRERGRLRLQVHGESMLPALWPGNVVEIASCSLDDARPGEIVLALRDGRFFLHRFLARRGADRFALRGDSMPAPIPSSATTLSSGDLSGVLTTSISNCARSRATVYCYWRSDSCSVIPAMRAALL